MQISSEGGSVHNELTAVATMPLRASPTPVAMIETVLVRRRMARLKSSAGSVLNGSTASAKALRALMPPLQ
jgi:hypothetical protein